MRALILVGVLIQITISSFSRVYAGVFGLILTTVILAWGLSVYSNTGHYMVWFGFLEMSQMGFFMFCAFWYGFDIYQIVGGVQQKKLIEAQADSIDYEELVARVGGKGEEAGKAEKDRAAKLTEEAALLLEENKWDEVTKKAEAAITLDSNNEMAWKIKGFSLFQLGRYDESIAFLEKGIALNPDNPSNGTYITVLNVAKARMGENKEAQPDMQNTEIQKENVPAVVKEGSAEKLSHQV